MEVVVIYYRELFKVFLVCKGQNGGFLLTLIVTLSAVHVIWQVLWYRN